MNINKCLTITYSNKRNTYNSSYNFERFVLDNTEKVKDFGVIFDSTLHSDLFIIYDYINDLSFALNIIEDIFFMRMTTLTVSSPNLNTFIGK